MTLYAPFVRTGKPIVVDGRNLYDAAKLRSLGFTYDSFGRAHA